MNIECFSNLDYSPGLSRYLIENPSHKYAYVDYMFEYEVQKGEDMRLDLVMQSIYNDMDTYKDADIILYINGIDNPLNIREGQIIKYIGKNELEQFRYTKVGGTQNGLAIKTIMGAPNKTTRVDSKRKKFLESGYTLPPVLLTKTEPAVKIDTTNIVVGGLK